MDRYISHKSSEAKLSFLPLGGSKMGGFPPDSSRETLQVSPHYCIGSGVIEAGCKTIIGKRLKRCQDQDECKRHGWRKRKARTREAVITIPVLRVRYPKCGKTRTILPDFLKPYGRYETQGHKELFVCTACLLDAYAKRENLIDGRMVKVVLENEFAV